MGIRWLHAASASVLAIAMAIIVAPEHRLGATSPRWPPSQQAQQAQQVQQPQPPQQPTFRAGVRLVRVDASVTTGGNKPITDLQASDFEVTEDGVVQRVETVQFQRLDGQPKSGGETSLEIRSRDHALAEAARDDVRVFVIFLDDYHIDRIPSVTIPLRRELTAFISRFQPTDLIAIVDPLTPSDAITFTRSQADLADIVRRFEGRHNEIFPVKSAAEEAQLKSGDVDRLRAQVTLSALSALCVHLGGLREGRKTVIFVSQGPPLMFASGTIELDLQDTIQSANRANVTIDVVDPRGLGAYIRAADSMYLLAAETGGRAILNTNNFGTGLRQVIEDASAYYLIGYTPTRSEDDGKYHKISVKVKRPGVHVLARQGYWAPSRKELDAVTEAANRPKVPGVANAMNAMARLEPRGAIQAWVGLSRTAQGRTLATVTWELATAAPTVAVDRLELEVVPAGARAPTGPPLVLPASNAGKPARPHESRVLPPGDVLLRFTARSVDGAAVDRWEQPLSVPDLSSPAVALATPRFSVAASLQELRELQANTDPIPRATRVFHQTDRVFVDVECYSTAANASPAITAQLLSADGKELLALPVSELHAGRLRLELPIRGLGKGTYMFRVRARVGDAQSEQVTAFRVTP
ncbi:MAG TPA: VWA domain-containing protein [Vicinamibacterales bacterium]